VAAQAAPGFVYALKLGQFGSHRMKLRDAATWLPNHWTAPSVSDPRWDRRWCSSATLARNPERLDEFLSVAPRTMRWALEVRDRAGCRRRLTVLERHHAALCIHDLLDTPGIRTTDWTYVRFHGPNALHEKYVGRYGGRRLWRAADRVASWRPGRRRVLLLQQRLHGAAVADAEWSGPGHARCSTSRRRRQSERAFRRLSMRSVITAESGRRPVGRRLLDRDLTAVAVGRTWMSTPQCPPAGT